MLAPHPDRKQKKGGRVIGHLFLFYRLLFLFSLLFQLVFPLSLFFCLRFFLFDLCFFFLDRKGGNKSGTLGVLCIEFDVATHSTG